MWYPDSKSWDIARSAIAVESDDVRDNVEVMEVALDNVAEPEVLAGVAGAGPRITLSRVQWRSSPWLASYVDEKDYAREEILFATRTTAEAWIAARIVEALEEFEDEEVTYEGWPSA